MEKEEPGVVVSPGSPWLCGLVCPWDMLWGGGSLPPGLRLSPERRLCLRARGFRVRGELEPQLAGLAVFDE